MKSILPLPDLPIDFVIYRYGYLYTVQDALVTVLAPNGNSRMHELEYAPSTWASYGGAFVLYHPERGLTQFSGDRISMSFTSEAGQRFNAPHALPLRDKSPLIAGPEALSLDDVNGLPLAGTTLVTASSLTLPELPASALSESDHTLVFTHDPQRFSYYNGQVGTLPYSNPPKLVVPYAYPQQGLLAGGYDDGYLFSPDMGVSWRTRTLGGWGALTERAIVRVLPGAGVELVQGWW
jgi:hypothetical protein